MNIRLATAWEQCNAAVGPIGKALRGMCSSAVNCRAEPGSYEVRVRLEAAGVNRRTPIADAVPRPPWSIRGS